jgi:DNA replication protein DnaC
MFDCNLCNNKGYTLNTKGDVLTAIVCECVKKKKSIRAIEKSGLSQLLEIYTFGNYIATENWQKNIKEKAMSYCNNQKGWFGMFGSVGTGKSHICTAICKSFLDQGKSVRYMAWRDDVVRLKAIVTDNYEYSKAINELKRADVLYIDDLFKTETSKRPTQGDINIAFELINFRYNNPDLITILSSEKVLTELLEIDEAVGSRIYERCKDNAINISGKNHRLKGV